ncbi:transcription antitermination protein NusB domain protein [Enterococcus faecalis 13-SD-W-01]|nr:transcription antitermination protein NusB domain protein [Enterococcus faecalis 13-SD-W-01]
MKIERGMDRIQAPHDEGGKNSYSLQFFRIAAEVIKNVVFLVQESRIIKETSSKQNFKDNTYPNMERSYISRKIKGYEKRDAADVQQKIVQHDTKVKIID